MRRPTDPTVRETWEKLDLYRVRYDMTADLEAVASLERSVSRRAAREHSLRRRVEELKTQLEEASAELRAVEAEIQGAFAAGALLIEEIVDSVREREGEGWTPSPILGFRAWGLGQYSGIHGAREQWTRPTKTAQCGNTKQQMDVPHRWSTCGTPSCGIYATKDLETLHRELDMRRFGPIIGLVSLSGKVIEHEHGYRAKTATAVAVAGDLSGEWFATHDPDEISALFAEPHQTLERLASTRPVDVAAYLSHRKEVQATWTWETRSESSK